MAGDFEKWMADGEWSRALEAVTAHLIEHPTDDAARDGRITLLVAAEMFDEAASEIYTRRHQRPELSETVEDWIGLLDAAAKRRDFFATGEPVPSGLAPPPGWVVHFIEAVRSSASDDFDAVESALEAGFDDAPELAAVLDGQSVLDFRDVNDCIGPVFEALVPGAYLWLPMSEVRRVTLASIALTQRLDTLWQPATIELRDGQTGDLWLPAVYAGSAAQAGALALGHLTDYAEPTDALRLAFGQRKFRYQLTADAEDFFVVSQRVITTIEFA